MTDRDELLMVAIRTENGDTGGTGGSAADGHSPDGAPSPSGTSSPRGKSRPSGTSSPGGKSVPKPDGTSDLDGTTERKPETPKDAEKGLIKQEIKDKAKAKARDSVARGLIDFGLLAANSNQLKTVLKIGSDQDFYEVMLTLLSLTLFLQVTAGALKVVAEDRVGFALTASDKTKRCFELLLLLLVFAILVLNVFILTFGIAPKGKG